MAVEILNWFEIPVINMQKAKDFYESIFETKLLDLEVGDEVYPCFPNKNGNGFSGALVQNQVSSPGNKGPLLYFTSYGDMDAMIKRIKTAGGKIIGEKMEIAPGFGFYALFQDTEGNLLALQDIN